MQKLFLPVISLLFCLFFSGRPAHAAPPAGTSESFAAFVDKVERQTGYFIAYSPQEIVTNITVFPDITGLDAEGSLRKVLDTGRYTLTVTGRHIVIKKKPKKAEGTYPAPVIDSRLLIDSIPPPPPSLYSGETRLIIIRPNEPSSAAIVPLPPAEDLPADEPPTNHETVGAIPFRTDLLETDVYGKPENMAVSESGKRKKNKQGPDIPARAAVRKIESR